MDIVYLHLHKRLSKHVDHVPDGATHLELTTHGMDVINDVLEKDGAFQIPQVTMADMGAGYNVYLYRTAQSMKAIILGTSWSRTDARLMGKS
jgi:hypothetical protein